MLRHEEDAAPAPAAPAQQVVIKETIGEVVKIKCPFCGSLMDQVVHKCPSCGASAG